MSITLPKSLKTLRSLQTETVIPVELNDIDVDRMLTRIMEMAVKRGYTTPSQTKTDDYPRYLNALQSHPSMVGFDGERGRDLLDGWVRSSILREERVGLARGSVQMGYIRPITIAGYRSGLPRSPSRNRRADHLIYQAVERTLAHRGSANPSAHIEVLFRETFGTGVDIGTAPLYDARYDETTRVDIDTLLALRFLEGFDVNSKSSKDRQPLDPPVPLAVDPLGADVVAFLELYGPTMAVSEAFAHLSVIIAFRLLQLPLVTAHAVGQLLAHKQTANTNPCEMYFDFTRLRGSASDTLSYQCVLRDLEVLRTFFRSRLLMRTLGDAIPLLEVPPPPASTAAAQLALVAGLRDDSEMQAVMRFLLVRIAEELDDDSDDLRFVDDVRRTPGLSSVDKVMTILVEALHGRGLENQVKWFHNTGAITKSYGVLAATSVRARTTWRYAPTDEALSTLLCLCFVDGGGSRTVPHLGIRELLTRLRERFGIVIDRPPADLDSADARSGAADNLAAFTERLKLLGCFRGLADDFNAQFVTQPRRAVR